MGSPGASILLAVLLWVFLCAALAFFLAWLCRRARTRKPAEPSCGECGYNVYGLPTFTCPECGADLRAVGIVAPAPRAGVEKFLRGLVWTVLSLLIVRLVSMPVAVVVPNLITIHKLLAFAPPSSSIHQRITFENALQRRESSSRSF